MVLTSLRNENPFPVPIVNFIFFLRYTKLSKSLEQPYICTMAYKNVLGPSMNTILQVFSVAVLL